MGYVWLLWTEMDGRYWLDGVHQDEIRAMRAGRIAYLARTGMATLAGPARWHQTDAERWERELALARQKVECWKLNP